MFKHMFLGLGAASLLVVVTAMPVQAVSTGPLPGPLPPEVIVTRGDWQWVWVSPCVEEAGKSCSFGPVVDAYGFLPPVITDTSNPWTESFEGFRGDNGMLKAFGITENPNGTFSGDAICATPYFSQDHTQCNSGDLYQGVVWQAPFSTVTKDSTLLPDEGNPLRHPNNRLSAEVFRVQWIGSKPEPPPSSLPEPSSLLLLGAGLLGLAAWRWKHTA